MKTGVYSIGAIGGLSLFLLGSVTLAPARADDFTAMQNAIHRDINTIHDEEARLQGLEHKRHDQLQHGDWRNARGTRQRIIYTRNNLKRDRDMLRADQRALDRLRRLR